MIRSALRRNGHLTLRGSRNLSNNSILSSCSNILHRDVFIYDHSYSMKSWESIHTTKSSTKHPNSGHIVAEYSTYLHNSSKYNFNNLGEYSLIITSAIPLPASDNPASGHELVPDLSISSAVLRGPSEKTHSVLIHPDGLAISGLGSAEIPLIVDLVLKDQIINAAHLKSVLPGSCSVDKLPALVIIASSSKLSSMRTANQVLLWFRKALDTLSALQPNNNGVKNGTNKSEFPSPLLLLVSELGGHRNSSTVLLLPSEDSFEFVSTEEAAKSILINCRKDVL